MTNKQEKKKDQFIFTTMEQQSGTFFAHPMNFLKYHLNFWAVPSDAEEWEIWNKLLNAKNAPCGMH